MKLVYDVNQRPPLKKNLVYAFQQLLAIMAATLLVPILADATGLYLNQPAALFGAGVGTLFYILVATRRKSPVFLGSAFAFISPLASAVAYGFGGILLGSVFAGLVYVLIALIIKKTGSGMGQQAAAPRGHRPHRGPDRFEPVRQRREQPEQHRRRQLQSGFHSGGSGGLLHHRVRLREGPQEHAEWFPSSSAFWAPTSSRWC